MSEITQAKLISFACPKCKHPLRALENILQCDKCNQRYPIVDNIPNFISEEALVSVAPNYRDIKKLEFLAPIYEGQLWTSFILKMAGSHDNSVQSVASFISDALKGVTGAILDVACGPATYGRRMASIDRRVYGVDFSLGTLRQGMKNIIQDGLSGIQLARSRVEELPFEKAVFDGAICGGALHLFPDTMLALREIARTMKVGAPLVVTTFIAGHSPLSRLMKRRKNMHVFELLELQQNLKEAGFDGFESKQDGAFILFSTHKAFPRI